MQIAERILMLRRGSADVQVPIRIFAPEPDGSAWRCRYEIGWPDGVRKRFAGGGDSVQAICLALQMIGADIYTSPHHASGQLRWERDGGGYGFPVPKTIRDLLVGDDATFG